MPLGPVVASNQDKVAAIAAAQKQGRLPGHFAAVHLLGLVLTLSSFWVSNVPEYDVLVVRHSRAHRRRVVVDAVAALIAG